MIRANDSFIPNVAAETSLLRELTKNGVRFKWTEKHESQFQRVKKLFSDKMLLQYYDINKQTFIFVDASIHGFGAMLCQGSSIKDCSPVDVASRSTKGAESRYPQIDLEAMAIDFALQRFRFFLLGSPQVTVITDHKPLVPIFAHTRRGSIRCERIKLRNQDIDYIVKYQKGKSNMGDYFSRHPVPFDELDCSVQNEAEEHGKLLFALNTCTYTKSIPRTLIAAETNKDDTLRRLRLAIELGYFPPEDPLLKPYKNVLDGLSVVDGIIHRDSRCVLPDSLQEASIDNAHQGGHPGSARLKSLVRTYYWFPAMDNLIEQWVQSCECQLYNKDRLSSPITSAPTPDQPWEHVSADLLGPMPKDEHVLVVRDNLSRFPAAEIIKSTAAKDVIPALDKIYSDFGTPCSHKTDNGPPFNSEAFDDYSTQNNIKHKRTPPLHPRSNEAECTMKPLGKAMKMAHHNKTCKKQELNRFLRQYRATIHPSTGFTPGDVMFRAGYKTGQDKPLPPTDIIEKVKNRDRDSKSKNLKYVNSKRFTRRRSYLQGQLVLLQNDFRSRKFDPYYEVEPYLILSKQGELLQLLRRSDGRSVQRHTSNVKPFVSRKPCPLVDSYYSDSNDAQLSDIEDDSFQNAQEEHHIEQAVAEMPVDQPPQSVMPVVLPPQVPVPSNIDTSVRRSERPRTDTRTTKFKDFDT